MIWPTAVTDQAGDPIGPGRSCTERGCDDHEEALKASLAVLHDPDPPLIDEDQLAEQFALCVDLVELAVEA